MKEEKKEKIEIALLETKEQERSIKNWTRVTLKEQFHVQKSPWQEGELVKIITSSSPFKIPNNSVVMFLEYKILKYGVEKSKEMITVPNISEMLYHCITVLFNEEIVELYYQNIDNKIIKTNQP